MKIFSIFIFLFLLAGNVFANNIGNFLVEPSSTKMEQNEIFYISIWSTDKAGYQLSNLDPKFTVESNAVKIGQFYNCASAEGRDICGKYDQSFVGLEGGYVAKAQATEQTGTFNISIFSDSNRTTSSMFSVNVTGGNDVMQDEISEVSNLNAGPVAGGGINGGQYLLLGILLIITLSIYGMLLGKRSYKK